MKKQRWRLSKGKQYFCSYCGKRLDKRGLTQKEKKSSHQYCNSIHHMWDVGMDFSDFY
jgi:hypothetical protein